MQCYTVFLITANAPRVSGGFSAHHQELKSCTHSIGYMSSLLAATASVGELEFIDFIIESVSPQRELGPLFGNWIC